MNKWMIWGFCQIFGNTHVDSLVFTTTWRHHCLQSIRSTLRSAVGSHPAARRPQGKQHGGDAGDGGDFFFGKTHEAGPPRVYIISVSQKVA